MRIRKNVLSLTKTEFASFIDGLWALKESGVYDQFAARHYLAAMHETPWLNRDPQRMTPKRTQPHVGPAFLPWHRLFIHEFEMELGKVMKNDSFGLPYWDWSDAQNRDKIWRKNEIAYMGAGGKRENQFYVTDGPNDGARLYKQWRQYIRTDSQNMMDPQWVSDSRSGIQRLPVFDGQADTLDPEISDRLVDVKALLSINEYDTYPYAYGTDERYSPKPLPFRPRLEIYFHDAVHKWVGGMHDKNRPMWGMGSLASPNDPVFYLHHSNLDRLWALWQQQHGSRAFEPKDGGPPGHNLRDEMQLLTGRHKTAEAALDYATNLGYRYDMLEPSTPAHPPSTPHASSSHDGGSPESGPKALANETKVLHQQAVSIKTATPPVT